MATERPHWIVLGDPPAHWPNDAVLLVMWSVPLADGSGHAVRAVRRHQAVKLHQEGVLVGWEPKTQEQGRLDV